MCAWEQDPENAAFVQVWPEAQHRAALGDPTLRHFIIEADGRPAGFVLLAGIAGPDSAVEFRRIVVAEKRRGIGSAAVGRVIRYVFDELHATRIWLDFVAHNDRARRIYERHGFRALPGQRASAEVGGKSQPVIVMALSREAASRSE